MTLGATMIHRFYMRRSLNDFKEEVRPFLYSVVFPLINRSLAIDYREHGPVSRFQNRGRLNQAAVDRQCRPDEGQPAGEDLGPERFEGKLDAFQRDQG